MYPEQLCKYISSEYGTEERRVRFFKNHLPEAEYTGGYECDHILDLFKKYGPVNDEAPDHQQAECVQRWILVQYAGTEHEDYEFVKSYEATVIIDGPGCFEPFEKGELMDFLRSHHKFWCVLRSAA